MYSSSHLFPIHIIYVLIFPNIRDPDPRYTLGVPHCHIAMGIFVHFELNWTPWHMVPWSLEHNCPNQSDSQIANINITTICTIYMLYLGTLWLLFYYWTSKLINVFLFPSFSHSHHVRANFPKYKGSGPQITIYMLLDVNWSCVT
jgi:hypothetical protein